MDNNLEISTPPIKKQQVTRRDFLRLAAAAASGIVLTITKLDKLAAQGPVTPVPTGFPTPKPPPKETPAPQKITEKDTPVNRTIIAEPDGNGNINLANFDSFVDAANTPREVLGQDANRALLPTADTIPFISPDRDSFTFITIQDPTGEAKKLLAYSWVANHFSGQAMYTLRFPRSRTCQVPQIGLNYDVSTGQITGEKGGYDKEGYGIIPTTLEPFHEKIDKLSNDFEIIHIATRSAKEDGYISRTTCKPPRINGDNIEVDIMHINTIYLTKPDSILSAMYTNPRIEKVKQEGIITDVNVPKVTYRLVTADGNAIMDVPQQIGTTFLPEGPLKNGHRVRIKELYFATPNQRISSDNATLEKLTIGGAKVERVIQGGTWQELTIAFRNGFVRDYRRYFNLDLTAGRMLLPLDTGNLYLVDDRVRAPNTKEGYDSLMLIPINDPEIVPGNYDFILGPKSVPDLAKEFSLPSFAAGALGITGLALIKMLLGGREK